ncbi:hypothetical protein NEF87_002072 [Candidatus Lokiarchaeum ossiferum]|uniref:DJ-1/PfpI domain-containing protein n=1 Tax=Candidatus Lokiarchaeum ossiferum TaxID=2951803 RepID=A0ABY6HTW1_9ARCH|nr:hypothetical protein NEF87_002072 [Candidatus Lokiarchaeum sp. B-35]
MGRIKIKKVIILSLTITLFLNFNFAGAESQADDKENIEYPEYSALILLGTGYGWNFYDIKDILESWNWSITTASFSTTVSGCFNRESRSETCNLTIPSISKSSLRQYDCLIVPSGGHWEGLSSSSTVQDLIRAADNRGLVLMTICIGQAVLANAHNVLRGKDVALFGGSYAMVTEAGADTVTERVVTDGRIVTGGGGGGRNGGGYTRAPTNETCLAMREAIYNYKLTMKRITIGSAIGIPILLSGLGYFIYLIKSNKISLKK